jgi:hypothetical protein
MPKWVKFIAGILLLPICIGTAAAVWTALSNAGGMSVVWMPMLAGAACWVVVFVLLPKPMLVYVFGHELTHAVWTWLFGGSVKSFKARASGGHVITTKSNFLIALAPYFFPLYAVLVVVVFVIGDLFWHWRGRYLPWFHLALGAAYAFHVTLTYEILKTRQTDITGQGWLFSAVIIFIGNALVLAIGVPLLTGHGLLQALGWWFQSNGHVFEKLSRLL